MVIATMTEAAPLVVPMFCKDARVVRRYHHQAVTFPEL